MLYPRPGDNEYALLTKWLRNRGGVFRPGDSETDLWAKLVRLVSPGAQLQGDSELILARKFLLGVGGTHRGGSNYPQILRRIVHEFGLKDTEVDNSWASLAKLVVGAQCGLLPSGFTYLLDGDGNKILDGNGQPFIVIL